MAENPDLTIIPDKAEVWIALAADVEDVNTIIPATADATPAAPLKHSGLIDDKKGIPLNPSGEVKKYNAFSRPRFRTKFRNGELTSGATLFEDNEVTRKIVLPGSAANKIGPPKNVQVYVLYKFVDLDVPNGSRVWVTLRPALAELKSHGGIVDGELTWAEVIFHHTTDAAGDVFEVVGGPQDGADRLARAASS